MALKRFIKRTFNFLLGQLLLDIATKAAETVNAKFVSIDLLEESGSHDLMVLELNRLCYWPKSTPGVR